MIPNDYEIAQRHSELIQEARNERLAKLAVSAERQTRGKWRFSFNWNRQESKPAPLLQPCCV